MRATARGRLLLSVAVAMALASLPLQSVTPALGGLLLLGLVASARRGVQAAEVRVELQADRRCVAGQPFLARARAQVQPALPCKVEASVPSTLRVEAVDAPRGMGEATWEAALLPSEPGLVRLSGARVEVTDPLGLWAREVPLACEAEVSVLPEPGFARGGAGMGSIERLAQGKRAFEETVEVERIRPYQPGDRLRDIDWAHSSKFQHLVTRQRLREAPRPILAVVDATRTMRWKRQTAMTATSARVVMALAGAARGAGLPMGLVVYADEGVVQLVRATRAVDAVEGTARALADLPENLPMDGMPAMRGSEAPLSEEERRFLARLAPFVQGPLPGSSPLDAALAAVATASGHPSIVVLVTSVDHAPRAAVVAAQRLARKGHLVAVVSPRLPAHLLTREEAKQRPALVAWALRNRSEARLQLRRLGVPLILVQRGEELEGVREVVGWAR